MPYGVHLDRYRDVGLGIVSGWIYQRDRVHRDGCWGWIYEGWGTGDVSAAATHTVQSFPMTLSRMSAILSVPFSTNATSSSMEPHSPAALGVSRACCLSCDGITQPEASSEGGVSSTTSERSSALLFRWLWWWDAFPRSILKSPISLSQVLPGMQPGEPQ